MRRVLLWAFYVTAVVSAVLFLAAMAVILHPLRYFGQLESAPIEVRIEICCFEFVAAAPYIVPLLLVLPTIQVCLILRQNGKPPVGHCQVCGYDLRATTDRCPECGMVAKSKVTS